MPVSLRRHLRACLTLLFHPVFPIVFPCSSSSAFDAVRAHVYTVAVDEPRRTTTAVDAPRPTAARDTRIATRVAAAVQPRGASSPTAVPEYHSRIWLRIPDSYTGEPQQLIGSQVPEAFGSFPKGAKFLSLRVDIGEAGSEESFILASHGQPVSLYPEH